MPPGRVSFLIVGSPRSGTTLVQRLATEFSGVAIPFETHFFTKGLAAFVEQGGFPIAGRALRDALSEYIRLPALADSGLETDVILDRLGPEPAGALAVFDAVVDTAAGPHQVLGEKTPGHVSWIARLCGLRPDLTVIGVVRDPRAVIASRREVPWGGSSVEAQATRWLDTQRRLTEVAKQWPGRCLIVRYEDVVTDPEGARRQIGELIGREPTDVEEGPRPDTLGLGWERWKDRAGQDITDDRVGRWREHLTPIEATRIAAVCRPMLARFGYDAEPARGPSWSMARASLAGRSDRARARARIRAETEYVARVDLGPAAEVSGPPAG